MDDAMQPSPFAGDRLAAAVLLDAEALHGLRLAESLLESPCRATRAIAAEYRARCLRVLGRRS